MTIYTYDTEFLEDGSTIALISIGIVSEDGREYYAVNADMPVRRIRKNRWLMQNVIRSLPQGHGDYRNHMPRKWIVDYLDPSVKPRRLIAAEVREFLTVTGDVELWADYAAYDHVVLAQLWGKMIDLPDGIPMWTNDIEQEIRRAPGFVKPEQAEGEHNALADARHNLDVLRALGIVKAGD